MLNKKNKIYMWYKVQELYEKGFNKSQISGQTELDRATVRKYLIMSENEFHSWISNARNIPLKLSKFMPFVKKELQNFPDFSAAQIEDKLKENFQDLPDFHSKTVYNFVRTVRKKYDIPKPKKKDSRVFEKLPETAYGKQAQVDFGETFMQTPEGKRKKVYFFAMVLSRSRYKFIYIENKPFTSATSSYAHELAFEYFEGVPKEIIYDQDSVFIHDENLGDYLLTKNFQAYSKTQDFKIIFCRKADPQSKGKVENVIKYVKQNFLRGRKFADIQTLNKDAHAWLKRTGNAKIHSTTKKTPFEEWQKEKQYLLPVKIKTESKQVFKTYKVRKDNTIAYKGNFYSLPAGTYKNKETIIFLKEKNNNLNIYSDNKSLITSHEISIIRGNYIRNTDHKREKSETTQIRQKEVLQILKATETSELFLNLLKKDKPRYYRDNLQYIIERMKKYSQVIINESLLFCIENKQFNASILLQVMDKKDRENKQKQEAETIVKSMGMSFVKQKNKSGLKTEKSNINKYQKLFESWNS